MCNGMQSRQPTCQKRAFSSRGFYVDEEGQAWRFRAVVLSDRRRSTFHTFADIERLEIGNELIAADHVRYLGYRVTRQAAGKITLGAVTRMAWDA